MQEPATDEVLIRREGRAGRITMIAQQLYKPADADPTHATIAVYNAVWRPICGMIHHTISARPMSQADMNRN